MKRIITPKSLLGVIGMVALVATEVFAAAAAIRWAVSGAFGMGPIATTVLSIVLGVAGLFAVAVVGYFAYDAETDPDNAAR